MIEQAGMTSGKDDDLPYRTGVGMMLLNRTGEVFVGQRIDTTMEAWQLPQGGVDDGEDFETAALRELEEEIGTANIDILLWRRVRQSRISIVCISFLAAFRPLSV